MTSSQIIHIHPAAPAKPAVGAPCNGCGVCCLSEPCPLGVLLSRKRRGACHALVWVESAGVYRCGVMLKPVLGRLAARWIAAGIGCDSTLEVSAQSTTIRP